MPKKLNIPKTKKKKKIKLNPKGLLKSVVARKKRMKKLLDAMK